MGGSHKVRGRSVHEALAVHCMLRHLLPRVYVYGSQAFLEHASDAGTPLSSSISVDVGSPSLGMP